jgi:sporulation-specific protein 4
MSEPIIIPQSLAVDPAPVGEVAVVADVTVTGAESPMAPRGEIDPVEPAATNYQTAARIMTYPLVKETADFLLSIPGVMAVENTKSSVMEPVTTYIHGQAMLKPVIESIDHIGQQTLDTVDNAAPFLKTATYASVGDVIKTPFIQMEQTTQQAVQWTEETVDRTVVSPTRKMVHDFRAYYNRNVYDTKGKPLIRGSFDPVMRSMNRSIEGFAKKTLPKWEPVGTDCNTEIGKTFALTKDLTVHAIPEIINMKTEIVKMPYTYTVHAIHVFQQNMLKEQSNIVIAPFRVTYASSIELAEEAWSATKKIIIWPDPVRPCAEILTNGEEEMSTEPPVEEQPAEETAPKAAEMSDPVVISKEATTVDGIQA